PGPERREAGDLRSGISSVTGAWSGGEGFEGFDPFVRFGNVGEDLVVHVMSDHFRADSDRVHDGDSVARSVRFEDVSAKTEERSAAVAVGAELAFHLLERSH